MCNHHGLLLGVGAHPPRYMQYVKLYMLRTMRASRCDAHQTCVTLPGRCRVSDIQPFFRSISAVYAGNIVGIPLTGQISTLYYRKDVLAAAHMVGVLCSRFDVNCSNISPDVNCMLCSLMMCSKQCFNPI